jgi:hypothetical protein
MLVFPERGHKQGIYMTWWELDILNQMSIISLHYFCYRLLHPAVVINTEIATKSLQFRFLIFKISIIMVRHVSSTAWKPNPTPRITTEPIPLVDGHVSRRWVFLSESKRLFPPGGLLYALPFFICFHFFSNSLLCCFDFLRPFSCIEEGKACGCTTVQQRKSHAFSRVVPAPSDSKIISQHCWKVRERTSPSLNPSHFDQWPCFQGNFVNPVRISFFP